MKEVICVEEDNHGLVGIATDYQSAIDGLVQIDWLNDQTEIYTEIKGIDRYFTLKEILGNNWLNEIKLWNEDKFNEFFEGMFYLDKMEVWG